MDFNYFKKKYQKREVERFPNNVTEHPLVSVIVVTYQHEKFIRQCLDCILMQETTFVFEVVLGEDASSDKTREICIEYAQKYPSKIRLLLHQRANNIAINGLPTGRFNSIYNLFSANGKLLAYCEGDDYWTDPLKLEKQVQFLLNNEQFDLVSHNMSELNELDGKEKFLPTLPFLLDFYHFVKNGCGGVYTCSMVFRNTSAIRNKVFSEYSLKLDGLDQLIILGACSGGKKIAILEDKMATYRIHKGGVWTSGNKKHQAIHTFITYRMYKKIGGFAGSELKYLSFLKIKGLLWLVRFDIKNKTNFIRKFIYKVLFSIFNSQTVSKGIKLFLLNCIENYFKKRIRYELGEII